MTPGPYFFSCRSSNQAVFDPHSCASNQLCPVQRRTFSVHGNLEQKGSKVGQTSYAKDEETYLDVRMLPRRNLWWIFFEIFLGVDQLIAMGNKQF